MDSLPPLLTAHRAEQRAALASPMRLEILGQFVEGEPMAVAELAERMGRPANAIHYHVRRLVGVGLLKRAGERRRGTRREALYRPAARRIALPTPTRGPGREAALKTLSAALRMTERDFEAALEAGDVVADGPGRTMTAFRLHARLTPAALARVNRHIDAMLEILEREGGRRRLPPDAKHHCSLTLALLPLRGRGD